MKFNLKAHLRVISINHHEKTKRYLNNFFLSKGTVASGYSGNTCYTGILDLNIPLFMTIRNRRILTALTTDSINKGMIPEGTDLNGLWAIQIVYTLQNGDKFLTYEACEYDWIIQDIQLFSDKKSARIYKDSHNLHTFADGWVFDWETNKHVKYTRKVYKVVKLPKGYPQNLRRCRGGDVRILP